MNIDHLDALSALETAYHLLLDTYQTMPESHKLYPALDRWLTWYERAGSHPPEIEGVPV